MEYLYATREALVFWAAGAKAQYDGPSSNAKVVREARGRVLSALDNDVNSSVALSIIAELAKVANELTSQLPKLKKDAKAQATAQGLAAAAVEALDACCEPLGLMQASPDEFFARTRARRLRYVGQMRRPSRPRS